MTRRSISAGVNSCQSRRSGSRSIVASVGTDATLPPARPQSKSSMSALPMYSALAHSSGQEIHLGRIRHGGREYEQLTARGREPCDRTLDGIDSQHGAGGDSLRVLAGIRVVVEQRAAHFVL